MDAGLTFNLPLPLPNKIDRLSSLVIRLEKPLDVPVSLVAQTQRRVPAAGILVKKPYRPIAD